MTPPDPTTCIRCSTDITGRAWSLKDDGRACQDTVQCKARLKERR